MFRAGSGTSDSAESKISADQFTTNPRREVPKRRGAELGLLGFAVIITISGFLLVTVNQTDQLNSNLLWYALSFLVVLVGAHLAMRRWAPYADPVLLPCVTLLNGLGVVMIYRIDLAQAAQMGKGYVPEAPDQMLYSAISLAAFVVVLRLVSDHRTLTRYAYVCGLVGVVALATPAVLPSSISEANGAKIWIKLGFISVQPAEFAKILLMIFFASFLVSKRDLFMTAGKKIFGVELPRARDLGPILIAALACLGILVFEKDLGTSLLFFGIVLMMLYVATERAVWVVIGLSMFAVGCVIAYQLFEHVQNRVANWIAPLERYGMVGGGYQISESLFGLATGGLFGTGLGNGHPAIVPAAQTDFIASALGEELGFVGLSAILVVYLLLTVRGLRSALAVRDSFGKLLGGGLAFSVLLQTFVIVGGVTRLIPMTGLTTPFMSAGGSSLLANYILMALLIRISDAARRPNSRSQSSPKEQARKEMPALADANTVMVQRPTENGDPGNGAPGNGAWGTTNGTGEQHSSSGSSGVNT